MSPLITEIDILRKNEEVIILQIGEDGNIVKLGKKENSCLEQLMLRMRKGRYFGDRKNESGREKAAGRHTEL